MTEPDWTIEIPERRPIGTDRMYRHHRGKTDEVEQIKDGERAAADEAARRCYRPIADLTGSARMRKVRMTYWCPRERDQHALVEIFAVNREDAGAREASFGDDQQLWLAVAHTMKSAPRIDWLNWPFSGSWWGVPWLPASCRDGSARLAIGFLLMLTTTVQDPGLSPVGLKVETGNGGATTGMTWRQRGASPTAQPR